MLRDLGTDSVRRPARRSSRGLAAGQLVESVVAAAVGHESAGSSHRAAAAGACKVDWMRQKADWENAILNNLVRKGRDNAGSSQRAAARACKVYWMSQKAT